jgi:hypothetical protein
LTGSRRSVYSLAGRLPWQRRGWGIDSMRNCRTEIARSITVAVIKKNYEVWILNVFFEGMKPTSSLWLY